MILNKFTYFTLTLVQPASSKCTLTNLLRVGMGIFFFFNSFRSKEVEPTLRAFSEQSKKLCLNSRLLEFFMVNLKVINAMFKNYFKVLHMSYVAFIN